MSVPSDIKKNVRSVLLSKIGGVLVSEFAKDYKSLLREPLRHKSLGFETMTDFIKAMPDVVRLEFDDHSMAYKMFGKGDPNMYMSGSAKKAERGLGGTSDPANVGIQTYDTNRDASEFDGQLNANAKGLYTLCYPRSKESKGFTEEDVEEKFSEYDVADVNMIPGLIFVRFGKRPNAIDCLLKYRTQLDMRVADERKGRNNDEKRSRNTAIYQNKRTESKGSPKESEDTLIQKKPRPARGSDKKIELYMGNIDKDVTEEDIEELLRPFAPSSWRMVKPRNDPRKIFSFVDFRPNQADKAEEAIRELNQMPWRGRKLNVRYANEDQKTPSKPQADSQASIGKSISAVSRKEKMVSVADDEEEEWGEEEESSSNRGQSKSVDKSGIVNGERIQTLSAKMSSLTVDTNTFSNSTNSKSPMTSPPNLNPKVNKYPMTSPPNRNPKVNKYPMTSPPSLEPLYNKSPQMSPPSLEPISNVSPQMGPPRLEPINNVSPQMGPPRLEPITSPLRSPHATSSYSPKQRFSYKKSSPVKSRPGGGGDAVEMPPLEPINPLEDMPNLEAIERPVMLFLSNFVYYETEHDIAALFAPYGFQNVEIRNNIDRRKSTSALVTVANMKMANQAILELDQSYYRNRRLLVCIAKEDPAYEPSSVFTPEKDLRLIKCTIGAQGAAQRDVSMGEEYLCEMQRGRGPKHTKDGYRNRMISPAHSSSSSSLDTNISDTPVVKKTFSSLLMTYKIIMNKLGGRIRDLTFNVNDELTVFITSIFDETHFWGQIIQDEDSLSSLDMIMTNLQYMETRVGATKGLGRCAAYYEGEWYRGWITADRPGFKVDVFFVDYGNTSSMDKNLTSLTVPEIWEVKPVVRPFRITEGSLPLTKEMDMKIAILKVTRVSVDDTNYLTEVQITATPEPDEEASPV